MSGKAVDALVANHRRFLSFLERRVAAFVRGLERAGDIRDGERRRALEKRTAETLARDRRETADPDLDFPTLMPEYADILRRVDLEGARPVDVAAKEGITPNLALVRLHRARRSLRERLERSCGTCAEHGCLACSCRPAAPATAAPAGRV